MTPAIGRWVVPSVTTPLTAAVPSVGAAAARGVCLTSRIARSAAPTTVWPANSAMRPAVQTRRVDNLLLLFPAQDVAVSSSGRVRHREAVIGRPRPGDG